MNTNLSIEELRRRFSYDPETGILTRRISRSQMVAGDRAGWLAADGYRYVRVWKGDFCEAEFCQHNIVGVYFSQEQHDGR